MIRKHGGKRPGAGRKPKPDGKTAAFNTRITAETRAALEVEAETYGVSVSRMAELLISRGLEARRDAERNDATRALCHVVGELAAIVATDKLAVEDSQGLAWRNDPFTYEAFKLSISKFMDAIRPAGEVRSPVERLPALKGTTAWGPLDSIEARAEWAASVMLHNLRAADRIIESQAIREANFDLSAAQQKQASDTYYGLVKARRGLNLLGDDK